MYTYIHAIEHYFSSCEVITYAKVLHTVCIWFLIETNFYIADLNNYYYNKCPYYGFLKMTFHAVCNTALSELTHPAKF